MKKVIFLIASCLLAMNAFAKGSALEEQVRGALGEMSKGTCSPERLAPYLRSICDSQPQTAEHLARLGSIEKMDDYGVQQMPNGQKPTTFRVTFQKGIMTWMAEAGQDGKLTMLWSDGQTQQR